MKLTLRHALFPNCREATQLQSEALDRPVSLLERAGLGFHRLYCKWCRRYGQQIRFLRLVAQKHEIRLEQNPGETLSPEARERIKQTLRARGEQ